MARVPDDPSFGALVHLDRPLAPAAAWAIMIVPVVVVAGAVIPVNPAAWPLSVGLLVGLSLVSVLIFGDRLLIEQRVHERALVSRTLLPLRPVWVLPLALVPPERVRATGRVNWEDPGERMLPASGVLRSLPWGRVVRVPGPNAFAAKVRRDGQTLTPVPRYLATAGSIGNGDGDQLWAFSFRDPDGAARSLAGLAHAERARLGLDRLS